jgi:hypothetical protein
MRTVLLLIGIAITGATLLAMIQAMLIPRASRSLVARGIARGAHRLMLGPVALLRSYRAQDRWLALSPPIAILIELALYVAILIVGLGCVVYGVTDLGFGQSLYQSGSTLTTLGIVEPVNVASAITVYVAAFLGLVVIAIFIGYLMSLNAAFAERESPMVRLSALAGQPAWGPMVLLRAHRLGMPLEDAPKASEWIDWVTTTRMNHEVSPMLAWFRSTTHRRHWAISLLAVLDAVALRLAMSHEAARPEDVQLLVVGALALDASARRPSDGERLTTWEIEDRVLATLAPSAAGVAAEAGEVGVDEADVAAALAGLRAAGVPCATDDRDAWRTFAALRALYFAPAARLALVLHAVPAPWSGPRRSSVATLWPDRADLLRAGPGGSA